MNHSSPALPSGQDFENLLEILTSIQHLRPHEPLSAALGRAVDEICVCPVAVEQALGWLNLDSGQSIGRLRRTELVQLARTIHRMWRAAAAGANAGVSQTP